MPMDWLLGLTEDIRSSPTAGLRVATPLPPPLKPPLPHAISHDRRKPAHQRGDQHRPEAAAEAVFADRRPDAGREERAEPGQPGRGPRHPP